MELLLQEYNNGNYTIKIYEDGTKERIYVTDPSPEFPESMDVKITNYCVGADCKFCHERSDSNGKHGDLDFAIKLFSALPAGTELAIGGGDPTSHPNVEYMLSELKNIGVISNITVNSLHIRKNFEQLREWIQNKYIHGLGISYTPAMMDQCVAIAKESSNVVFHMIMGVNTVDDLNRLIEKVENPKVLLLGYKQYGRGESYYNEKVEDTKYEWYVRLHEFFNKKNLTLSFDNLGIKQVNLKRFFSDYKWKEFYMGDDGKFTMYFDMVKQQYAMSSTSKERFDIGNKTVKQMFSEIRQNS
jgi:MoaA/NifB/PqqE/SkfB family radical SAM enzyme